MFFQFIANPAQSPTKMETPSEHHFLYLSMNPGIQLDPVRRTSKIICLTLLVQTLLEDFNFLIPVDALVPYHERIFALRYEATRH